MSDLISREAVIDALDAICERECEYSKPQRAVMCGACRLGSAFDVVDELSSAQPEIVRCKDCKYYVIHTLFGRSQGWCERLCDEFDRSLARGTEPDDFCSRAERRTDEAD